MVSSVSQNQIIPAKTTSATQPKTTKASIFYVNDIHGQVPKMERIKTASDAFDTFTPSEKTDKLKFDSGDIMLGENEKVNEAAAKFEKSIGIDAKTLGNHECDISPEKLAELTKDAKYKIVGLNVKIDPKLEMSKRVQKSYIAEKDGNKYGVIGLMPYDLFKRIKYKDKFSGFEIENPENTIKDVQAEVDKLKKEGVDKIIVISHTGYANDVKLAKSVEGLDVILGGHSHDYLEGLEEGKNLFYSEKTGEPTIITQTGKDGDNFGILNLEFNENGVITSAQNNVTKSNNFSKNQPLKYILDKLLGKAEVVGTIASAPPTPANQLICENPHADFLADAMKSEMNTDIAIINAANLRGGFEAGTIDTRDVSSITPFRNKLTIINVNEKELVDALKKGAKTLTSKDNKPGILEVSGLKYTINKSGELLKASYINKDNQEILLDVNNPNPFKSYSVAIDDYYASGGDNFTMLNKIKDEKTKVFDFDKDKTAIDYIKKLNKPIEIKADGRIQVVD